jgi:HK97 family phage major capsid protein
MDPAWAGNFVSDEGAVFADFLEFLRPMTIVGKFGTDGIPGLRRIPFRVPVGSQTSGGAGYWVGEGLAKPLTRFDFGKTVLEPLKVANICVVTEELLRYAAIPAETLLRDQLAAAITARIDTDFIDPAKTAVANISPAAVTNGVTPVASSGVDADAVRADVAALIDVYIAANNPLATAVWVMSGRTASRLGMMTNLNGGQEFPGVTVRGGTLAGFPVIVSEYVTTSGGSPNTRYVWLINANDVFFADEGGINVDMSREASLQMDNAPTMASAELGSPQTPIPTTSVSMFQTNSVAFRAERSLNWAKARTEAVQGLSGVVWGT